MSIEKVPAIFTGQAWDKKVSVELDHSDITMSELLDVFKGLALSLGFSEEIWKEAVLDMTHEYEEDMKGVSEPIMECTWPYNSIPADSTNTDLPLIEDIIRSILSGEIYSINAEPTESVKKSKKKKSK